ncbi:hypothetical protein [Agromyces aerolatus]|uniref:hypothetical protein n=1 Tax=Agromyces sp. LY-1074 TaxID=3074080 RepID=UPI0028664570|nr:MULTISPECIES: hypothetical protein [unclassified Agromyces]MDR5701537.1 hypothetical protein [Agromyces sp. LY-1074]MDR5707856.1 hypothetical protein [Agromyces sp. LY-1358]
MTTRTPLPARFARQSFTTREALSAGVTPGRLRALDLEAPTSGARVARGAPLDERARAILRTRPDAFLCGASAGWWLGLPLPWRLRGALEIGVPAPGRSPRRRGILGRSLTLRPDEVIVVNGARVTTPSRTFCDLARQLTVPELVAVVDRLTTPVVVDTYPDHRLRARLAAAHALRDPTSESPKESELRAILALAGLPPTRPQAVISDGRRFVARVDLLFERQGEVLEYQGDHHRTDLAQWRRDRTREADLEALGYHVTEVTQADLRTPRALVTRVAATSLAAAGTADRISRRGSRVDVRIRRSWPPSTRNS